MTWRKRKEVIVLTNLLAFLLGLLFLLLSDRYFTSEAFITVFGLLGAYLTVSVIVNLFHRSFLKPSEDEARKRELEYLLDERINAILGNSAKYGFSGFLGEMDYKSLFLSLEENDTLWWLDTYCPAHELWEDDLRCAISRGARIRMLLLSPETKYAVDRAGEIGGTYTAERFKKELRNFKEALEIIQRETVEKSGSLELVEYKDRPGMPVYLVCKSDGVLFGFSSLFLGKPTGVAFPHMKWTMSEYGVIQHLLDYVQKKWERNQGRLDDPSRF